MKKGLSVDRDSHRGVDQNDNHPNDEYINGDNTADTLNDGDKSVEEKRADRIYWRWRKEDDDDDFDIPEVSDSLKISPRSYTTQ